MNSKQILLQALDHYKINVIDIQENYIHVIKDYKIEIEKNGIFKLTENNTVIAPFDDLNELCHFILTY